MNNPTVGGFDSDLERRLREVARERGVSLNKAAILLMRRDAGLEESVEHEGAIGSSLDAFFGGWSTGETREFFGSRRDLRANR